jgi:hypothetical protein
MQDCLEEKQKSEKNQLAIQCNKVIKKSLSISRKTLFIRYRLFGKITPNLYLLWYGNILDKVL